MITGKIKDTELKGLSTAANDYSCADGGLQVCHNMVNNGGGLRPVERYETVENISERHELLYVHHTATGMVYITLMEGEGGTLWWQKSGETEVHSIAGTDDLWQEGCQITSVGNILIITDGEDTLQYILWTAGEYKVLGSKMPELKIEFGLKISRKDTQDPDALVIKASSTSGIPTIEEADESEDAEYGGIDLDDSGHIYEYFTNTLLSSNEYSGIQYWLINQLADQDGKAAEKMKQDIATSFNSVMATVNRMISEAKDGNCFTHPFFVRYAYEMYDGTVCMQSVPILMVPSTEINPVIFCQEIKSYWTWDGGNIENGPPRYVIYAAQLLCGQLRMRVKNADDLKDWKDIIQHVNIYVTPQTLPYDPDGRKMRVGNSYRIDDGCYSIGHRETASIIASNKISTADLISLDDTKFNSSTSKKVGYIYLPELTGTSYEKKIEEAYQFYLLKRYGLDELDALYSSSWYDVEFTKGALKTIETQEVMTDDYHTHDIIMAKVLNTYNNRLNRANCQLTPFTNMPGEWLSCYTSDMTGLSGVSSYSADIYIKENGVKIKVSTTSVSRMLMSGYFFYPNPNAYLMVIKRGDGKFCSLALERHPYLFGAYKYIKDFLTADDAFYWKSSITGDTAVTGESWFSYPNYMYTSEADNPFVFPAEGLNAVGTGAITTIKTATKAMSQGSAFGTNPLYVFCTDGIWALEVGDTGLFTAKQAVSRETLTGNDPKAATQADNSVLFLSERGLMELAGGETRLLSGALQESHHTFEVSELPQWTDILEKYGKQDYLEADDFTGCISGARIAFDYVNYRIFVFRPYSEDDAKSATAYVYDIGGGMWGTVANRMKSVVEDGGKTYVNAYYPGGDGSYEYLYASLFAQGTDNTFGDGKGFYVTRPMKLDAADTLKTVRMLVERGATQTPRYLAMWGSRDMKTWALIGAVVGDRMPRISGTPWKYIVVGGWAQLSINGDNISRLTMDVKEKYGDKLR